ncbi:MAG: cobalamin-dependent protein [Acidimicrobiia bacterium]|nr:cobalamin-dependent protein [Acidimicrobiia bacterium]
MASERDEQEARLAFLAAVLGADVGTAYRLALDLLDRGVPLDTIVSRALAPNQAEIGERWERGDLGVADEHGATAAIEDLLALLAFPLEADPDARAVVVACAEGDTHALSTRSVAAALGLAGWKVTLLGASLPADELGRFLGQHRPEALALSCTIPSALPGARRSIRAAHRAKVPVLAGGRAFGPDGHRAIALGADAWAPDATSAVETLERWTPDPERAEAAVPQPHPECEALALRRVSLTDVALTRAREREPFEAGDADRLADEVGALLRVAEASILLDEPAVLADFLAWQRRTLAAHGFAEGVVDEVLGALVGALDDLPTTRRLLQDARQGSS